MADKASLTELKTTWTIYDLLDCHDALDYQIEFERCVHKEVQEKSTQT